jgi:TRAP-type C4-dicarboxylate transport system permease small subunit
VFSFDVLREFFVFKLLKNINGIIGRILDALMVVLMSLMTVFIFLQVIYRYILKQPLSWSEELSRYLFSGVTLFGAVLLYRSNGHINMSLLKDLIKIKPVQVAIDFIAGLLTLVFLVIVIRYGFPMSFQILKLGVSSPSMPWLKMGYVFLLLPFAAVFSVLMVIETTTTVILRFIDGEKK